MRFGSMFSGIEAASVAWKPLGWECQWVAEIEKFPSAVLAHHYPDVPNLGDVTKVDWEYIRATRPVDCIVFGSPCQSFSVAGKRLGLDDPRGNLALYALSVVNRLRPSWFVFENVPGLLSSGGGRDFGAFLGTVGDIGYQCAWRVLDAQHFGLAQRRARVFVVGHLGDWRRAAAVLFERESLCGHPAPRREAGERVAGTLEASLGRRNGQPNDHDPAGGLIETVGALCADTHLTSAANYSNPKQGNPCHPLAAGAHAPAIAFNWQSGGDARGLDLTPVTSALSRQQTPATLNSSAVRRLTPRECERLQGFPDDYTLVPYRNKPAADGPRYKALGNSMAVPVMRWIGERIAMVEQFTQRAAA